MKPPTIGPGSSGGYEPPPPPDPLPMLWATGAIFGVSGILVALVDHPLVPLSHVFGMLPLGLGGAIGAAILRERYGPRASVAFVLVMVYMVWQVVSSQTTVGPVFIAAGLFSLTRAIVRTAEWEF